jgi:uncharacterized protein (TIGR03437 family)
MVSRKTKQGRILRTTLAVFLAGCSAGYGQVSSSAYRVLGQADLRHSGLNMVQGVELALPAGVALDARDGQLHVYIADSGNSRVLAWSDFNSYQIGDAPTLVLGEPGPQYSGPLGIGVKGFYSPTGLAVDPLSGNLYVADTGNNRVVRFPAPFANPSRIEPDAVYGQTSFTNRTAAASSSTLNAPRGVAFDSAGNLWVADTGNHRVMRFPASVLNNQTPPIAADLVIGQKDFSGNSANAGASVSGSGFSTPIGLAFDTQGNLYVADFANTRVLKFSAPLNPSSPNPTASGIWGESNFASRGVPQQATASSLAGPVGLAADANNLYVAVQNDNRVLIFPLTPAIGATAKNALGQSDLTTTTANTGVYPLASQNTLSAPSDVKVDQNGNILVADTANNRVLSFPTGSKSANRVWGQTDFVANGTNRVKPGSLSAPYKIAIDYSSSPFALYVSDPGNNRVLGWKDAVRFRSGDPADLVIGQANMSTNAANVDTQGSANPSRTSLSGPRGLAVNPSDGTLYVADTGNNRVLRFPRPVSQSGRIAPDAVIGQLDFTSSTSAAVNASSLNTPAGVAIGPNGDLFVADSGNHRVLEFAASPGTGAAAIRVYGQPGMTTGVKPVQMSAQTLSGPQGIYVDSASNLYVADTGANRVVVFPNTQNAPVAGMPATFVIGQGSFNSGSAGTLKSPIDAAVDSAGSIYVSDYGDNRVLYYSSLLFLPLAGGTPLGAVGQPNTTSTAANWDTTDGQATADSLNSPAGVYLDRQDTLYVADAGNSRVLHFLKSAAVVNAATFQSSVAVGQGGLATLFGSGLASNSAAFNGTPWPTSLSNRQVLINDTIAAPFYYIDSAQVNLQVPSNAPLGSNRIALALADTGELVAGGSFLVAAVSPGLFTAAQNGSGQAAVLNQDNTLNSATNAAPRGSVISLFGTGQGQVSPGVPDGTPASASPLSSTVAVPTADSKTCISSQTSMCVVIGSGFGQVQYSGLAPGFIGLWQINVKIPADAPTGNVGLRVIIDGTPSNQVTVAIK